MYIVKLGLRGYTLFFLVSAQNTDCGYSLEPPRRGGSNDTHNLYFEQKYEKKNQSFLSENFQFFLEIKFPIYLNRRAFVMVVRVTYANSEGPYQPTHPCICSEHFLFDYTLSCMELFCKRRFYQPKGTCTCS